jgi:serine/threonine protein kinase
MWSVGCILGELISRKVVFRGKSSIEQILLIIDLLGKPEKEEMGHIDDEDVKDFLINLKSSEKKDMTEIFQMSGSSIEIDLLSKMLVFDPKKRIDVDKALNHEYFNDYKEYLEKSEKTEIIMDFDNKKMNEKEIRELLFNEVQSYKIFRKSLQKMTN